MKHLHLLMAALLSLALLGPIGAQPAKPDKNAPADPGGAEEYPTSPEKRKKHEKPKEGKVLEISIKLLGNFDYDIEKGGIPEDVKKLSGSKLRLRGFMMPLTEPERITEFALVPSLFACCFGQMPQIQHSITVRTPKGKQVSYFPDEIIVEGVLKVEEKKEDGIIINIFDIDCTSVKPVE